MNQSVTLTPAVFWKTVHMSMGPLVLEQGVGQGPHVGGDSRPRTFSNVLMRHTLRIDSAVGQQRRK